MASTQPKGCLFFLLQLFSPASNSSSCEELPYRLRDDFLSPAELSFYRVLQAALHNRVVLLSKVNLADIFFVLKPSENVAYRNKIDRKHVDFLVCDPDSMKPLCGIELDDASHSRTDRRDRDAFVDQVFEDAKLPLVRVRASRTYNPHEIVSSIEPYLVPSSVHQRSPAEPIEDGKPQCPKCGVPMVLRHATQGKHAGRPFFGCPNYPRCRELVS